MWLPLILKVDRKQTKKMAGNICNWTPDIEFEQERSVGLGATLRDRQKIKNYFFLVSIMFSGKAVIVILLGFECTINPQKFKRNRYSHFWENRNFKCFSYVTTLNFEGSSKTKTQAGDVCKGTPDFEFEQDWSVGLGSVSWRSDN